MHDSEKWYKIFQNKRPTLHDTAILELGARIKKKKSIARKEYIEIMSWKLGNRNYGTWFMRNSQEKLDSCFTLDFFEENYDCITTRKRLDSLCDLLSYIGVPVASAFLAAIFPNEYGVIDRFSLLALGMHKNAPNQYIKKEMEISKDDYLEYLNKIREISAKTKLTPKEIDNALMTKGFYLNNINDPNIKNKVNENYENRFATNQSFEK